MMSAATGGVTGRGMLSILAFATHSANRCATYRAMRRSLICARIGRIFDPMAQALTGINVLEFHSNLGAAYAAMLLAEQGADTIMVEQTGGAPQRGTAHFQVLNRSKRSVAIDI